jgi:hypothetical protein
MPKQHWDDVDRDTLRQQINAEGILQPMRVSVRNSCHIVHKLEALLPFRHAAFRLRCLQRASPDSSPYNVSVEVTEAAQDGTDLVLGQNIRGDGRQDIMNYVEGAGSLPRAFVFVSPPAQGAQSIRGAGDAVAFAHAVRETLGELLKKYNLRKTRLFFYGPFALSVFLGQQLTSVGEIQLFEYQDPSYVPSCSFKT